MPTEVLGFTSPLRLATTIRSLSSGLAAAFCSKSPATTARQNQIANQGTQSFCPNGRSRGAIFPVPDVLQQGKRGNHFASRTRAIETSAPLPSFSAISLSWRLVPTWKTIVHTDGARFL